MVSFDKVEIKKVIVQKTQMGNTTYKVTLPKTWVEAMGIDVDGDKQVTLVFDETNKMIAIAGGMAVEPNSKMKSFLMGGETNG